MTDRRRAAIARTSSTLAIAIAALAAMPAVAQQAQVRPGDARCPIVAGVVTCSGAIPEGVVVVDADNTNELIVRDLTVPIAPAAGRSGIDVRRATGPVTIRMLAGPNGITVRGPADASTAAAGILANTGGDILIDNALGITAITTGMFGTNFPQAIRARLEAPAGAAAGRVDIRNSGTLSGGILTEMLQSGALRITNTGAIANRTGIEALFLQEGGIFDVGVNNSGTLEITRGRGAGISLAPRIGGRSFLSSLSLVNSGVITGIGQTGILVESDGYIGGGNFSVLNTGAITVRTSFNGEFEGAIVARSTRPDGTAATAGTILIDNRAPLTLSALSGQSVSGAGIAARDGNSIVRNTGAIIATAGRATGSNTSGLINGILAFNGNTEIINSAPITINGNGRGIYQANATRVDRLLSMSLSNTGKIALDGGEYGKTGIEILASGTAFIENSGDIDLGSPIGAFELGANSIILASQTDAQLNNRGNIVVNAPGAAGIRLLEISITRDEDLAILAYDPLLDLKGSISATHSGNITALGDGATGIAIATGDLTSLFGEDCSEALFLCDAGPRFLREYDGRVSTTIESGTITGGTGTGAGVSMLGIGTHILDNRGTISALSGHAIVTGVGRDTIINRGTITGSVALGDNDDRFVLTATGNLPSVDGGAGSDTFALEAAAGTPFTFDVARASTLAGFEGFAVQGTGIVSLTGVAPAALPRALFVEGGTATVETDLSGFTAQVLAGATLAGTGTIGATMVSDGATLSPGGDAVGTLSLGSVTLAEGSILRFDLGLPDRVGGTDNDLLRVGGDLLLDGTLNVIAQPQFGDGVYRLIDYTGTLTDNGLAIAALPGGASGQVQTVVPRQVNLVVGSATQFWDGTDTAADLAVDGGTDTWNTTTTNWTRRGGDVNEAWGSAFAVFQGAPGTVTIAAEGVAATGLQFAVDGYRVEGGPLTLNAPATLRVGDGSAAGAGYSTTIASNIAGAGGLFKTDLGTLILTGTNSHTGGTGVSGGTLQVASDANLGAASGGVTLNGGTLRAAGALTTARAFTVTADGGTLDTVANTVTLSGTLSGTGAFTKTGTGTLSYTGTGSTLTGSTRIAGGTLALGGSLGGPLVVASGATLTGTGRAASLDLAGTIAPGNSPGTLTFTGDAVFRAGSTYQVELAGSGATDRIQVGGAATIQSGSVVISQIDPRSAYTDGAVYRILDATGGRTGTFTGVTRNSLLFGFTLGYDPTGAFVTARQIATTYNQGQAATGLEALDRTAGSDGAGVFAALLALDSDPLRAALDASSGEVYAGLVADMLGQGMARADRLAARAHGAIGEGWGIWGGIDGRTGRIAGDGNAARLDASSYGLDLGIDYRGTGNAWAVGVGGGYVRGSLDLDDRASRSRSDGWQLGGYGRYGTGGVGLTASVAATYGRADADVARSITFAGVGRTARGNADVKGTAVNGELRYGLAVAGGWSLGPVGSVSHARATVDGIRESGSASLALVGGGDSGRRTRYGGGAFVNWQSGRGAIDASAQYVGGDSSTSDVDLAFAGAPGTKFDIRAPRIRGGAGLFSLASRYDLGGRWSLASEVRATIAQDQRALAANATLGWRF